MIIVKEYKFYAAHRNEEIEGKCRNIHGHRYGLRCHFRVERTCSYSTLFSAFDDKIEPYLKEHYDHGMLIHVQDPLYLTLLDHMQRTGEKFKLKQFDGPTSVENLAYLLFGEITDMGFELERIEVRETDTSVLVYSESDWLRDRQIQESKRSSLKSKASNQRRAEVNSDESSGASTTSLSTNDPTIQHGIPADATR